MADDTEKLIRMVVEDVLAEVRKAQAEKVHPGGGEASTPTRAPASAPSSASVRPPIGVCTGDYSKFAELRGKRGGAGQVNPAGSSPDTPVSTNPHASHGPPVSHVALSGIVTAQQLKDAVAASSDGVATLGPKARLTPLASDYVREFPQRVRRTAGPVATQGGGSGGVTASATEQPQQQPPTWLWWADGHCPGVQDVTAQYALRQRLAPSANRREASGLTGVVRDLAEGIAKGRLAGGVLFVHSAARAVCYANRCRSIRAVVATCGEAVEQGINELGANVLIIEYPHVSATKMREMVERFTAARPELAANVRRALDELHEC